MQRATVVGAGVIGLSTAWELSRRGWQVTVVDPNPAKGASWAAAGMLAPVSEVVYGQESLYPLMTASAAAYPDFVARLVHDSGAEVGYRTTETLVCGFDAADRRQLVDLAERQRSLGMEVEPLTGSQARRLEPALSPAVSGAVRIPTDHQIDPRRLMAALRKVLEGAGVSIVPVRVVALERTGNRWTGVRLADGQLLEADEIALCSGLTVSDIAGLPDGLDLPLRPVWGDILRIRVPARLEPLISRTVRALVQGFPVYLVPRADGQVVVGATSREDGHAGVSTGGVYQLLRDANRVLPGVLECDLEETGARARPGTPDDIPLIGRLGPGLTLSTGYFRHGILLSPLGARLTADAVAGAAPDPAYAAAVDPYRFTDSNCAEEIEPPSSKEPR